MIQRLPSRLRTTLATMTRPSRSASAPSISRPWGTKGSARPLRQPAASEASRNLAKAPDWAGRRAPEPRCTSWKSRPPKPRASKRPWAWAQMSSSSLLRVLPSLWAWAQMSSSLFRVLPSLFGLMAIEMLVLVMDGCGAPGDQRKGTGIAAHEEGLDCSEKENAVVCRKTRPIHIIHPLLVLECPPPCSITDSLPTYLPTQPPKPQQRLRNPTASLQHQYHHHHQSS